MTARSPRILGLALLGVAVLAVLAACGADPTPTATAAPVPTATPTATAAPVPTATPTRPPAPGTTPVAAAPTATPTATPKPAPKDDLTLKAEFRIMAGLVSAAPFVEGWREMIARGTGNRITMVPQDATEADAVDFIGRNPQQYTRTIFRLNEDHVPLWDAGLNFTGGKTISPRPMNLFMQFPAACMNWYTLDPKIKTIFDFTGKRVHIGTPGNTVQPVAERLIKAAGMEGKFTPIIGGRNSVDQLADREVDVTGSGIIFAGHPLGSATAQYNQLAALTGKMHFVSTPLEVINKAREQNPDWVKGGLLPPVKIYKGDLSAAAKVNYPIAQEDGYCVGSITVNFQTSPNTEETLMYQVVKSLIDNRALADTYFPFVSQVWKERLGHTWNLQSSFHPGARRAYEETGVTYGVEGIRAWEAKNPRK